MRDTSVSSDGLIQVEDELPPGLSGRLGAILACGVFLLAICGTAITDTLFPARPLRLIGAEAQAEAARRRDARLRDGSLARLVEHDLRLRSRVRRTVLPFYSLLLYVYLSEGTEHVVVGRGGWLFAVERMQVPAVEDEVLARRSVAFFAALDRRLESLGTRLVLMPVPRKAVVGRDFLPSTIDPRPGVEAALVTGLRERGLDTVDLLEAYRDREAAEIYFETDTHWTPTAARIAAEALARTAGLLRPEAERLGRLEVRIDDDPRRRHDLIAFIGIDFNPEDLGVLDLHEVEEVIVRFPGEIESWYAAPSPEVDLALAGTSFSAQQDLARTLGHYTGERVWNGARPAQPYLQPVRQLLREYRHRGRLPERLFIEFAVHHSYRADVEDRSIWFGWPAAEIFVENPPGGSVPVAAVPAAWWGSPGTGASLDEQDSRLLVQAPAGAIAHTGDGAASLRLRGRLRGKEAKLEFRTGVFLQRFRLKPGKIDLTLPLLAPAPGSEPFELRVLDPSPVELSIDRLAIVHEGDPASVIPLTDDGSGSAPGSSARLIPTRPTRLGRRAAIIAALILDRTEGRTVTITARTEGANDPVWQARFQDLAPRSRMCLDLGALHGKVLTALEVTVSGPPLPWSPVAQAKLVAGYRD